MQRSFQYELHVFITNVIDIKRIISFIIDEYIHGVRATNAAAHAAMHVENAALHAANAGVAAIKAAIHRMRMRRFIIIIN